MHAATVAAHPGHRIAVMPASLRITSDLGELRRMSAWLREAAQAAALGTRDLYALELCANEAVSNTTQYGNAAAGHRGILLEFCADVEGFALRIEDEASPYDPTSAPLPVPPASLDEAPLGGLGLVLIQRLLPLSQYRREGDRNILVLQGTRSRD
jgi:serine/threonine-protein kinase RsbW